MNKSMRALSHIRQPVGHGVKPDPDPEKKAASCGLLMTDRRADTIGGAPGLGLPMKRNGKRSQVQG